MIMFFVLLYILSGCKPLHYVLYHTGLKISTFLDIYFHFTPTPVLIGIQAIEGRMITDFVHKMLKGEHFSHYFGGRLNSNNSPAFVFRLQTSCHAKPLRRGLMYLCHPLFHGICPANLFLLLPIVVFTNLSHLDNI